MCTAFCIDAPSSSLVHVAISVDRLGICLIKSFVLINMSRLGMDVVTVPTLVHFGSGLFAIYRLCTSPDLRQRERVNGFSYFAIQGGTI